LSRDWVLLEIVCERRVFSFVGCGVNIVFMSIIIILFNLNLDNIKVPVYNYITLFFFYKCSLKRTLLSSKKATIERDLKYFLDLCDIKKLYKKIYSDYIFRTKTKKKNVKKNVTYTIFEIFQVPSYIFFVVQIKFLKKKLWTRYITVWLKWESVLLCFVFIWWA